jgi:uncharacterized low-complexity protein
MGEFGEAMNQAEKPRLVPGSGEVDPVGGLDMTNKEGVKPIALACGITLAGSFAAVSVAQADSGTSPFAMTTLSAGYLLGAQEGTCGEGKCGEGKCGGDDKGGHVNDEDAVEGKCGEGKCGEGKCGGDDKGGHVHDAEEGEEEA